ncbi:hypothetical protein [Empedobacter falsenii]|uniref:Uncharacterized protein n=1 Tax=Empedobacter falsenii TaxID=343874 RepID=A0AAW7DFA5_9FLAO|nr:hypothetical protein [Empedobacter falsenii]MDM1550646.1 hypothetical protein [Empedobacter falsenii]
MSKVLEKYIKQRDYSGSVQDAYASLVYSCMISIGKPFEKLLEQAEKENKKIQLKDELVDEITLDNIEII